MTLKLDLFAIAAASLLPFAGYAAAQQKPFKNHDGTLSIWEYAAEKPAAPAGSTRSEGYGNKWGSGQMGNGDQLQK